MGKYDIPQYPTKRLRYFNNQFLKDTDFIDEQKGHLARERAFLRALFSPGVLEGLEIQFVSADSPLLVTPGVAVDRSGRLIVLDAAMNGPSPAGLAAGTYYLFIQYAEVASDPVPASENTRWSVQPVIGAVATTDTGSLPDAAIVLGSMGIGASHTVTSQGGDGRQYAGLLLKGFDTGAGVPVLATTTGGTAHTDNRVALSASLNLTQTIGRLDGPRLQLTAGQGFDQSRRVAIDLNVFDPGVSDPPAQIRALSDQTGSAHLYLSTKAPGAPTGALQDRLILSSNGDAQFTGAVRVDQLTVRHDTAGNIGPRLTLTNGATQSNTNKAAIDLNPFDPGANDPAVRIHALGDGNSSGKLVVSTKPPGAVTNQLVERLRISETAAEFKTPLTAGQLTARTDVSGGVGPKLTLTNGAAQAASSATLVDFHVHDPLANPAARLSAISDGNWSAALVLSTKDPGNSGGNALQERLRINSNGSVVIRRDAGAGLGASLALTNGAAQSSSNVAALDFNVYSTNSAPAARLHAIGDGNWSAALVLSTKEPGSDGGSLTERVKIASNGTVTVSGLLTANGDVTTGTITASTHRMTAIAVNAAQNTSLFANSADNELYWRSSSGTNVKLTSGAGLNVAGIGGDYQSSGALLSFDDANDTFAFQQQGNPRAWARVRAGDVDIYQTAANITNRVRLQSPASLANSYALTLPTALPSARSALLVDASGNITTQSNTINFPAAMAIATGSETFQLNAGFAFNSSTSGIVCPIVLPVGTQITSWKVYLQKGTSTGTIKAQLVFHDMSNNSFGGVGAQLSSTGSGTINIAGTTSTTVAANGSYFINVIGTGAGTIDWLLGWSVVTG